MKKTKSLLLAFSLLLGLAVVPVASADSEDDTQRRMYRPQIDRTVEKIDNGIKMTVASEDEEVVEYLQAKDRPGSKNELVTHVVENIENGVVITITTEDEDMLERLHNRADRLENGFIRRHKGMGRSMMKGMNGMMNRQGDMHDCSYKQQ